MPLRRGNWEMIADFSALVVEEKPVVEIEDKPKRGPGRPKKVADPVEDDEGTSAQD